MDYKGIRIHIYLVNKYATISQLTYKYIVTYWNMNQTPRADVESWEYCHCTSIILHELVYMGEHVERCINFGFWLYQKHNDDHSEYGLHDVSLIWLCNPHAFFIVRLIIRPNATRR